MIIRSGKSSIINVVLFKMPPNETLWIQATTAIKKYALQYDTPHPYLAKTPPDHCRSYRNYPIWDLPGQIDFLDSNFDTDSIFNSAGGIVWVIDAQDEYQDSITRLVQTYAQLQQSYPDIKYTVFVHKVDSLSPEGRDENHSDIMQRVQDDLEDAGVENPAINFYATSVYDHSVYDALSKVMQQLNPHLATFETLLNTLTASCRFEKLYLLDISTKLCIASDTSAVDPAAYQLCSDYIDTVLDLHGIYDYDRGQPEEGAATAQRSEIQGVESFMGGIGPYSIYLKEVNK